MKKNRIMGLKLATLLCTSMIFMLISLPPLYACGCPPHPPHRPATAVTPRCSPPARAPTPQGSQTPSPPQESKATCPIDALKLEACVDLLGGLVHVGIGDQVKSTCCPVLQGLLDLEAALRFCTALRTKLLNINIFLPLALKVLISCGKTTPPNFECPSLIM